MPSIGNGRKVGEGYIEVSPRIDRDRAQEVFQSAGGSFGQSFGDKFDAESSKKISASTVKMARSDTFRRSGQLGGLGFGDSFDRSYTSRISKGWKTFRSKDLGDWNLHGVHTGTGMAHRFGKAAEGKLAAGWRGFRNKDVSDWATHGMMSGHRFGGFFSRVAQKTGIGGLIEGFKKNAPMFKKAGEDGGNVLGRGLQQSLSPHFWARMIRDNFIIGLTAGVVMPLMAVSRAIISIVKPALAAIPITLSTILMGAAALIPVFIGVGGAIKTAFDPSKAEEFQKALAKLSPSAQRFVLAIRDGVRELKNWKNGIQESFFRAAELDGVIKGLVVNLQKSSAQFQQAAASMGGLVRETLNWLNTAKGVQWMQTSLTAFSRTIDGVRKGITPLADGFATLSNKASKYASTVGNAIGDWMTKFGKWMGQINFDQLVQKAKRPLNEIKQLLSNTFAILKTVFNEMTAGMLTVFVEITGAVRKVVTSPEGVKALHSFFTNLNTAVHLLRPAIETFFKAMLTVLSAVAPYLPDIARGVGSVITGFSQLVVTLLPFLKLGLQIIAHVLVPLLVALKNCPAVLAIVAVAIMTFTGFMKTMSIIVTVTKWIKNAKLMLDAYRGATMAAATSSSKFAVTGRALRSVVNSVKNAVSSATTSIIHSTAAQKLWNVACAAGRGISAGFNAAIRGLKAAFSFVKSGQLMATIQQWLFNASLYACPLFWIIAAILAVAAIFVVLWMKCAWFRNFWKLMWHYILVAIKAVWDWIKHNWPLLIGAIGGPIGIAIAFVVTHWHTVWTWTKRIFGWIRDFFVGIWNAIASFFVGIWNGIVNWFKSSLQAYIDFWRGVWSAIRDFFVGIWNAIVNFFVGLWNAIYNWFKSVNQAYLDFWRGVWNAVKDFFVGLWNAIKNFFVGIWNSIVDFFKKSAKAYHDFWVSVWNAIKNFFVGLWNGIKNFFVNIWNSIYNWFKDKISAVVDYFVNYFNKARDFFVGIWNKIHDFIKDLLDKVKNVFKNAVDGIKEFWDKLVDIAKKPVAFVVNTVYNNGIRKFWNFIADKIGMGDKKLDPIEGWAEGGLIPGKPSRTDNRLAMVATGEYIMPTDKTRLYLPLLEAMRSGALGGIKGYADGGKVDEGGFKGFIQEWNPGAIAGKAWNFVFGESIGKLVEMGGEALKKMLPKIPGGSGMWSDMINKMPAQAIDKVVNFLKKLADDKDAEVTSQQVSGKVKDLAGLVKKALEMCGAPAGWLNGILTLIQRESGGNPNAINRTDSNAQAGHPSQGLMQTIPSTFAAHHLPGTSNNILDPLANVCAGIRYIMATYHGGLPQQADPNASPIGYDAGGLLQPGLTPVWNGTGRPEKVLDADRSAKLDRLLDGDFFPDKIECDIYDSRGVLLDHVRGEIRKNNQRLASTLNSGRRS